MIDPREVGAFLKDGNSIDGVEFGLSANREFEGEMTLDRAIFGLNEDGSFILPSMRAIIETVFMQELAGIDQQQRDAKIQQLISTNVTPYIHDHVTAYASLKSNRKTRQNPLSGKIRKYLTAFDYPDSLSPRELGELMSRQTSLPIILARRNSAL